MATIGVEVDTASVAASAPVLVSLETYLNSSYEPDCDWVDGELKERNLGESPHATVQGFIIWTLTNVEQTAQIRVLPEQRVQTSARHYRVADVCVIRRETPFEAIVRTPPLLCVEVLSREDRMSEIHEKIDDYLQMGVDTVWIVDPRRRRAHQATQGGALLPASEELTVAGTSLSVSVAEMFAKLDWMETQG